VDFQQYFPIDSIIKVEVSGLPEKFWRQNGTTKIIFETLQQSQSMILKVTGKK
jgi:D-hexose-6-phosphate mutarotase